MPELHLAGQPGVFIPLLSAPRLPLPIDEVRVSACLPTDFQVRPKGGFGRRVHIACLTGFEIFVPANILFTYALTKQEHFHSVRQCIDTYSIPTCSTYKKRLAGMSTSKSRANPANI